MLLVLGEELCVKEHFLTLKILLHYVQVAFKIHLKMVFVKRLLLTKFLNVCIHIWPALISICMYINIYIYILCICIHGML